MKTQTINAIAGVAGAAASFTSAIGLEVGVLVMSATFKSPVAQIAMFTIGTFGASLASIGIGKATENYVEELITI